MGNTVVAIFEDVSGARQAETYLLEQGFKQSEINLKTAVYKKESEDDGDDSQKSGVFDSVKAFFVDIFANDDEASRYHLASRNRTIVTVHTIIDDDAETAANILDRYGAIHVAAPGSVSTEDHNRQLAGIVKSRIIRRARGKQEHDQH